MSVTDREWSMLVAGGPSAASGGATYDTHDPATGARLGAVPSAAAEDVDRAVAGAVDAAAGWRRTAPAERAAALRRFAAIARANEEELGLLDALDSGNPVTAMRGDVRLGADLVDMVADWVGALGGRTYPGEHDHLHYSVREPYGVVARIVPYNHPVMFALSRVAAPLLAGNAVVLKAPDQTPLSALRLAELTADVFPPGVLSVVTGSGAVAGAALVAHPAVRRIGFIGSVATGQRILQGAAAAGIKHVTLELGGKNPMIVLDDADPGRAASGAVRGMNFHWTAGQSCGSTSRLLVHRSLADQVTEAVVEHVRAVRMGGTTDPATEMGSLVSPQHRDRVLGLVEGGVADGLRLVTGGGPPDGLGGAYVAPTVFADVPPGAHLAQEEVFGPVLVVVPFDDDDEALAIANGSTLGLTASIWTEDIGRAHRLVRDVEAGYVWVNTVSRHFAGLPFGGVKDSGVGREEAVEELHSFTQVKAVTLDVGRHG
jgi:2-formylbenzoate dehydrogenase